MPRLISERVDALAGDFDRCVSQFYSADRFPHSAWYFHTRTVELFRKEPYADLLAGEEFIEKVYATLATWGLDRMGGGKRLNEFQLFRKAILRDENVAILKELATTRLSGLSGDRSNSVKQRLATLYDGLTGTMLTDDKLVGFAKTMHHLLPDLAPPIDRRYTLKFFYHRRFMKEPQIPPNEKRVFIEIFDQFRLIAEKVGLSDKSLTRKWDTSVPKLIDNAIIGFVVLKMSDQANQVTPASPE